MKTNTVDAKHANKQDVITLLKADHTLINLVLPQYTEAKSATKKKTLVAQLCLELRIHMQTKEEVFYPAIKKTLENKALIENIFQEHALLREFIAKIENLEPDGETYDAKVHSLCHYATRCFQDEANSIFTEVQSSNVNLLLLGERFSACRDRLHAEQEQLLL